MGVAIGVAIVSTLSVVISVLHDVGFIGVLRALFLAVGVLIAFWLIRTLLRVSKRVFELSPPLLQAIFTVALQFIAVVAACFIGSRVYDQWEKVEERPEMLITLDQANGVRPSQWGQALGFGVDGSD